jgi:hypothetical protein
MYGKQLNVVVVNTKRSLKIYQVKVYVPIKFMLIGVSSISDPNKVPQGLPISKVFTDAVHITISKINNTWSKIYIKPLGLLNQTKEEQSLQTKQKLYK